MTGCAELLGSSLVSVTQPAAFATTLKSEQNSNDTTKCSQLKGIHSFSPSNILKWQRFDSFPEKNKFANI